MIDNALVTLIQAHSGTAKVFSGGERVQVARSIPCIFYTLISTDERRHDAGSGQVIAADYQLDVFAARPSEARATAEAIRTALSAYRGTTDGTVIRSIWIDRLRFAQPDPGMATNQRTAVARIIMDLRTVYQTN